ncbi:MAG TPA: TlyA family rRNA (cytidine-2'-O)-methyltransferase [Nitrospinae bacterium]|nr:TlyA family rRNA (cytidine-2'-O)-methyltransferase [Nitrospinota bacterium]
MPKGRRLDLLLVERGLAPSRERARSLILAGRVTVKKVLADKAGSAYPTEAEIIVAEDPCPYVSRGGLKLSAALDAFDVSPEGRICLDVGASTGGFTDVMLQRGARRAVCVDVGKGQLDWTLRKDPRVTVLEGINARHLTPDEFTRAAGDDLPDLATLDLSFISATKVLPAVGALLAEDSEIILLAKPQFEAGKGQIGKGGIVRDPAVHRTVLETLWAWAAGNAFSPQAACASPIRGAKGNREFFLYLRPGAETGEMEAQIERALEERR